MTLKISHLILYLRKEKLLNIHSLYSWRSLGVIAWLLLAVTLTACGGAAQTEEAAPAAEEATAEEESATEAEEAAADTETDVAEEAEEAAAEEESVADAEEATANDDTATETEAEEATEMSDEESEEAEAADTNENLLDPSADPQEVACSPLEIPENTLIAEVSAEDWALGPEDAPITVIEYGDFQ